MTRDAAREAEEHLCPRFGDEKRLAYIRSGMNGRTQYVGREERTDEFLLRLHDALLAEIAALRRALDNISGIVSDGRADDVARADIAEELRCLAEESVPTPPAGGANG